MANISDIIEKYILSTIGNDIELCISRNGLASYFNVAPSQINYVLDTRFTIDRGYIIESRRGGGGYLTVMKICDGKNTYIKELIEREISSSITYYRCANILKRLVADDTVTVEEMDIILSALTDKALCVKDNTQDILRASIFKSVLTQILKRIKT